MFNFLMDFRRLMLNVYTHIWIKGSQVVTHTHTHSLCRIKCTSFAIPIAAIGVVSVLQWVGYKLFAWRSDVDNDNDNDNYDDTHGNSMRMLRLLLAPIFLHLLPYSTINKYKSISFHIYMLVHKWSMQCSFLRCLVLDVYYLECHTIFHLEALAFTRWLLWHVEFVCLCACVSTVSMRIVYMSDRVSRYTLFQL